MLPEAIFCVLWPESGSHEKVRAEIPLDWMNHTRMQSRCRVLSLWRKVTNVYLEVGEITSIIIFFLYQNVHLSEDHFVSFNVKKSYIEIAYIQWCLVTRSDNDSEKKKELWTYFTRRRMASGNISDSKFRGLQDLKRFVMNLQISSTNTSTLKSM